MVFNHACYPMLTKLFDELQVPSRPSDMSFSVSDDHANLEWCSSALSTIFAQRRNLIRPAFWRMLGAIPRFNKAAKRLLESEDDLTYSLADFLRDGAYPRAFVEHYLIPMGAAIWSADPTTFADFPAEMLFRFLNNHGLLSLRDRPKWRTVVGGSVRYVDAIAARLGDRVRLNAPVRRISRTNQGVELEVNGAIELYDHVILATHSDEALAVLVNPTSAEVEILGAIRYADNVATLHVDERVMPRRARARASWNYRCSPGATVPTLTYDVSRLQGFAAPETFYVTLNDEALIAPEAVRALVHYRHPVFDSAAMIAQTRHGEISGVDRVSFVGAYWGYGFHEDGARSAHVVVTALEAAAAMVNE
jgi:predicted NAD/FAD-binding protein